MVKKRGQVTIFVIIAILIVGGILGAYLLRDKITNALSNVPLELQPITDEIQTCVENTLQDGTKFVGLQGGYIIPPENALETNFSYIAYGYYLGTNTLASKTIIEKEIAKYIELTLPYCFDASGFSDYNIKTSDLKVETKINDNSVSASVNFPFSASKGNTTWSINKKYSTEYKAKLGNMYNAAQNIISKEIENPNIIDFTYLGNFNYDISILHEGNDVVVYSIADYNDLNGTGGYTFRFANKIR